VKFVEHHDVHASQLGIRDQPAGEDALGQKAKPRARPSDFFEANLIADGVANPLTKFLSDAARGKARSQTARFKNQNLPPNKGEQCWRNACRFPSPRRRFDHEIRMFAK
jgi:hypothetical protein